jgi:excisionase family DNA binding protein
MNNPNLSLYLTVDAAAQLLGLSHWTIRQKITRGELTRYKVGARTLVSRTELLERVTPVAAHFSTSSAANTFTR